MLKRAINLLKIKAYVLKNLSKTLRFPIAAIGMPVTENEKRLLLLKDQYVGKRAFIIGNGPSLKNMDISILKNEITIGCNGLFLMFDSLGFLPTFYTVEDVLVAEDRADIINKIGGTIKIFPYDLKYCLEPDEDTIYINFRRKYFGFPKFSSNFAANVYWGGTVTFLNLQLAYYLGIREIYLIGVDHSYHGPTSMDKQNGTIITSHSADINHFHADYFGAGFRYHNPRVDRMEVGYKKAKTFFSNNGVNAYNASGGGKLEVFERVDFTTLF